MNNIILSKKKAVLAQNEINFLGLYITDQKVQLQKHPLEKIQYFSLPKNKKDLQRFLGLITYIKSLGFLNNNSYKSSNLQKKLKKDVEWSWTQNDTKCFEELKQLCKNLPTLYQPKPEDKIEVETDASKTHWAGVILAIPIGTKKKQVVQFCNGTFSEAEKNYTTHEREVLALIKTLSKNRIYLLHQVFTVRTDSTYVVQFKKLDLKGSYKQGRLIT